MELLPVEIAEALERGATVVTGNQRAARALRRGFDQRNRERGLASWAPPPVMAWDAWMAALWHGLVIEGHAAQLLLNRTQEHVVWRTILEADEELDESADGGFAGGDGGRGVAAGLPLRRTAKTTRHVQGARIRARFSGGRERLNGVCKAEGFLAQAQLEETLRGAVEKGRCETSAGGVVLVGFDGMTPAQAKLVETLRSAGVDVEELRPASER